MSNEAAEGVLQRAAIRFGNDDDQSGDLEKAALEYARACGWTSPRTAAPIQLTVECPTYEIKLDAQLTKRCLELEAALREVEDIATSAGIDTVYETGCEISAVVRKVLDQPAEIG